MSYEVRIDRWLWAARIYKTRSLASEACKNGRITVGGVYVKSSRMIKPGDIIGVKKPPIVYTYRVLSVIEQRVGAKMLDKIYINETPEDQYSLLEMTRISGFVNRARGTGRPTKRDRRALDTFTNTTSDSSFSCEKENEDL